MAISSLFSTKTVARGALISGLCLLLSSFLFLFSKEGLSQEAAKVSSVEVNNIRLWDAPDHTRIVFDTSDKAVYQDLLINQKRLAVDIALGQNKAVLPDFSTSPRVQALRHGALTDGKYRYVFELKNEFEIKSFQLSPNKLYGHRVVVDLYDQVNRFEKKPELIDSSSTAVDVSKPLAVTASQVAADTKQLSKNNDIAQSIAEIEKELEELSVRKPQPQRVIEKPVIRKELAQKRSSKLVVAIDAGHGGEDPGAVGWRKLREKDITLKIAKKLHRLVNSDPTMEAHLVRTGDYFIRLRNRTRIARQKRADLFVSIHADAFTKKSANGLSVFALSQRGASSAMARTLAKKENAADLIGGVSLKDKDDLLAHILLDLSMTNKINESVEFGKDVLNKLKNVGRLHSKRVEQAGFAVLKSPDIPSILVETGFITNPDDARRLNTNAYQDTIARAVYDGIRDYYRKNPIDKAETSILVEQSSRLNQKVEVSEPSKVDINREPISASTVKTKPRYHKVKSGEALSLIAKRNGLKLSEIKRWNKLKSSRIFIGQKLVLSDPNSHSVDASRVLTKTKTTKIIKYKVKRGDSLSVIAAKYGVKQSAIKSLNKLKSSKLFVGKTLKIPQTKITTKQLVGQADKQKNNLPKYHKVRSGESLSTISAKYNIKVSALKKRNGLTSNRLIIGKRLLISNSGVKNSSQTVKAKKPKATSYKVKRGDTLSEIAEKFGFTMAELRKLNSMKNSRVYVGQKLKVRK